MKLNLQDLLKQYDTKTSGDDFPEDRKRFTDDKRTESRLLAVQAIFMVNESDRNPNGIVQECLDFSGLKSAHLDKKMFANLVEYILLQKEAIMAEIELQLTENWSLERIDPVVKSILIVAIGELLSKTNPSQIVVSEYLAISNAFVDQEQVKFINGVLASVINKYELS